jgi:hypothetical protein
MLILPLTRDVHTVSRSFFVSVKQFYAANSLVKILQALTI